MEFTLEPFTPTQAPTASTFGSFDHTAILLLLPASRAILLISTVPSWISATSASKSLFTSSGCVRLTRIRGPFGVSLTSRMYTLILSVGLSFSVLTCSLSFKIASAFPRLMEIFLPISRCTIPVTTSFAFS